MNALNYFLLFSILQIGSTLEFASPIIWRKSRKVPVVGYQYFTHLAHIKSPYDVFAKFESSAPITSALHTANCKKFYEAQIMDLIRTHCPASQQLEALGRESQSTSLAKRI